jgi:DNA-binding transcriptional MerR regulator
MEQWFGPVEMARRLGVTPKALRVYERHGLVTPVRDAAGWRAYGPEQAARLHQVLVLRQFGLPLKRIGELLAGRFASLDAVLAMQAELLEARRREADHALTLIAAARAKLTRKSAAMWQEANKDPDFARRGPFKPDLMAFVGEAWRRAQAG